MGNNYTGVVMWDIALLLAGAIHQQVLMVAAGLLEQVLIHKYAHSL